MGSLALGELIGSAAFIVSVIAGSMCAIKPFRAKKLSFLRDVSFFTVAICLVMGIVADGLIHIYEAILLIVFYVFYVFVVVGGNYYMKRRSTYLNLVERARLEYEETGIEVDSLLRGNTWDEPQTREDEMELYDEGFETEGFHSDHNHRRNVTHPKLRIRTSLFSAIEFQDVVNSLQRVNPRFHPGGHQLYSRIQAGEPPVSVPLTTRSLPTETGLTSADGSDARSTDIPSSDASIANYPQHTRFRIPIQKLRVHLHDISHHLFPSLTNFSQKSVYSKVSSLMSAPIIFLLAITLPVVKEDMAKRGNGVVLDDDAMAMLQDVADDDPLEMNELYESTFVWSQWLTATQLVCAPLFVAIVFAVNGIVPPVIIIPVAAALGVATAVAFKLTTSSTKQPRLYWMMCFVGFGIAVVWIYVIANEVVSVLQAVGMALGVSEAILGLTVFALGNSLGDFVANITMAKMGYPMMAISACFGGPMLNIMLGVGIGATYVTSQRQEPYKIDVSSTILVSATGLLLVLISSLVLVPLNGYRMSRYFGYAWMGVYLTCTIINLYLEIKS
ncbi:hypothetical protein DFQ28_005651 [Apophysomyces sp. BC1034]|nr:hypothetical protein DFQ29_006543 [Apophysomyces sp. BC1021]KAG0187936.1 hypothetical protein DFQ28_005651 [Apophysomyces sp. BC1034]